jgi:hypothetical protein
VNPLKDLLARVLQQPELEPRLRRWLTNLAERGEAGHVATGDPPRNRPAHRHLILVVCEYMHDFLDNFPPFRGN